MDQSGSVFQPSGGGYQLPPGFFSQAQCTTAPSSWWLSELQKIFGVKRVSKWGNHSKLYTASLVIKQGLGSGEAQKEQSRCQLEQEAHVQLLQKRW